MRHSENGEHWFYKQNNRVVGPISRQSLHNLVTGGHVLPNQAVWTRVGEDLTFLQAAATVETAREAERNGYEMAATNGGTF